MKLGPRLRQIIAPDVSKKIEAFGLALTQEAVEAARSEEWSIKQYSVQAIGGGGGAGTTIPILMTASGKRLFVVAKRFLDGESTTLVCAGNTTTAPAGNNSTRCLARAASPTAQCCMFAACLSASVVACGLETL